MNQKDPISNWDEHLRLGARYAETENAKSKTNYGRSFEILTMELNYCWKYHLQDTFNQTSIIISDGSRDLGPLID